MGGITDFQDLSPTPRLRPLGVPLASTGQGSLGGGSIALNGDTEFILELGLYRCDHSGRSVSQLRAPDICAGKCDQCRAVGAREAHTAPCKRVRTSRM